MKKRTLAVAILFTLLTSFSGAAFAKKGKGAKDGNNDPKKCEQVARIGEGESHQEEGKNNKKGCKHHKQNNKEGDKHEHCGDSSASGC